MPATLEEIKTRVRDAARDLCDHAYARPEFSDELALAAVSLSTTLKFINDELTKRANNLTSAQQPLGTPDSGTLPPGCNVVGD